MANSKISALTSATTPLAGTETLPIVQSNTTVKTTVENVFNATQPSGTAYGVVALNASKQAVTSTGIKWQSNSLAINAGANAPGYNVEVVGSFRYQDTFAQNGYELSPGSTNILTSYNRTTATWLTLRQRALSHEFYCNGSSTVNIDSGGNIVPQIAAKGINFTANTNAPGMTSQLLNWYEEGTWTPTITAVSGSYTTVQFQVGRYTRMGRMVHIVWTFTVTSVGTGATAYRVADLPFAINQTGLTAYTGSGYNNSTAVAHTIYASGSGTTIDVYRYDGTDPVVVNQGMVGSCTYFV